MTNKRKRNGPLTVQVGKNGFTEEVISQIRTLLNKNNSLRIVFLSNSTDRDNLKIYKEKLSKLFSWYSISSIGFTITLKKAVRQTK